MNRKQIYKAFFVSTSIVLIYYCVILPSGIFNRMRYWSGDLLQRFIFETLDVPEKSSEIVIVYINSESIERIKEQHPWPRRVYTKGLNALLKCQPKVVYLNMLFEGSTEDDEELLSVLQSSENVIVPYYIDESRGKVFSFNGYKFSKMGFCEYDIDKSIDQVVRKVSLVKFSSNDNEYELSAEALILSVYFGDKVKEVRSTSKGLLFEMEKNNEVIVPADPDGFLKINYCTNFAQLSSIPFWQVYDKNFDKNLLKDKIVILGMIDKDLYNTPIGILSGTEIIANTLTMMLSGKYVKYIHEYITLPLLLIMAIFITFIIIRFSPFKAMIYSSLVVLMSIGLTILLGFFRLYTESFSLVIVSVVIYFTIKIYRFICVINNKSLQLQKAYTDLQKTESELIQAERLAAVGKISAQVSHEIKNPLGALLVNVGNIGDLIKRNVKLDKAYEICDMVVGELKRLRRLSQDILSYSKLSEEEVSLININDIVVDIINIYRSHLEGYNIEIESELSSKMSLIKIDSDMFKQVIINLINNSQDAMPDGGIIKISTKSSIDNNIEVSVSDTGCGIPENIAGKIFDPFFSSKGKVKGSGLGLSTTSSIVKKYNGSIDLVSKEGEGTTFIIRFPIEKEENKNDTRI